MESQGRFRRSHGVPRGAPAGLRAFQEVSGVFKGVSDHTSRSQGRLRWFQWRRRGSHGSHGSQGHFRAFNRVSGGTLSFQEHFGRFPWVV